MTLSALTVSASAADPIESEVSLARLYVLRAIYLLLVIGGHRVSAAVDGP